MWTFKSALHTKHLPHVWQQCWLLTCVNSHVDFQVTTTSKSFPAYFASIWFLTSVPPHVDFQIASRYKNVHHMFGNNVASHQCDSSCGIHLRTLSKPFLTYFASIWFLTCVNSHVDFQTATSYKTFTTCLATMCLLTSVTPHVILKSPLRLNPFLHILHE